MLRTELIKTKREALGLTQAEAATKSGMGRKQAWYAIEKGTNKNVTIETLRAIAKVLKCKAGDLIDE